MDLACSASRVCPAPRLVGGKSCLSRSGRSRRRCSRLVVPSCPLLGSVQVRGRFPSEKNYRSSGREF